MVLILAVILGNSGCHIKCTELTADLYCFFFFTLGKGTISSRIVRDFGVEHLSSGNILQAEIANQSSTWFIIIFYYCI